MSEDTRPLAPTPRDHDHHSNHDQGMHTHEPRAGIFGLLLDAVAHLFGLHQDDSTRVFDSILESSTRGIWALKVSFLVMLATAIFQVVIVAMSSSVALLADTIHNFSDALTAIPLWMAFALNRRKPNRRYTYGYGRAEDLAGVMIVLMIFGSALVVFYESFQKILRPQPLTNLEWVALAAVTGFLGNEAVAVFRLRVGREIGSAALMADGMHARVDGITSLGVLFGVIGVCLGWPWADPVMGLMIGFAILFIVRDAAREMWHRLMDATDPDIVQRIEHTASLVEGVQSIRDVRARWVGHRLHTEMDVKVDGDLTVAQGHKIGEQVRHALFHELPALNNAIVHLDPCGHDNDDHHALTAHHSCN
jgi:cation diffusion facilitator family transporter